MFILKLGLFPILLVLYETCTYLTMDMYTSALPQLMSDFKIIQYQAQLTVTLWFLGAASMQIILGPLADRYGRRPILLGGGIIFLVATLICAITSNLTLFLVARFLQGCVVCSISIAGYSVIHELYDQKTSIKILALMGSVTILAPAFGPLAGSLIMYLLHWRWIFWLLLAWALFPIIFLIKCMPETNTRSQNALSIRTVWRDYKAILTNKTFLTHIFCFCLLFVGIIAWIALSPFIIIETLHYSPITFGLVQLLIFGGFILGNIFINHSIERYQLDELINFGLIIAVAGACLSVIFVIIFPEFLVGSLIGLTIYAMGTGSILGPLQRSAIEASPQPLGVTMAVFSCLVGLAASFASGIVASFYDGSLLSFFWIFPPCALAAFFLKYKSKKFLVSKEIL